MKRKRLIETKMEEKEEANEGDQEEMRPNVEESTSTICSSLKDLEWDELREGLLRLVGER